MPSNGFFKFLGWVGANAAGLFRPGQHAPPPSRPPRRLPVKPTRFFKTEPVLPPSTGLREWPGTAW